MEAAAAALIIGTGMKAYSEYDQGKDEKELAKQRAAAKAADAAAVKAESREEARTKREEGREFRGRQIAAYAKSGVLPSTASPLLAMVDTADEFETEAGYIQETGRRKASRLNQQAVWERRAGRNAYRAGLWGAGSTALTGAGRIGLYSYNKKKKNIYPY